MYALAAIINVTGLLFAAGVALRFRSLQATPLMQVPVFLFLFLAPVYVPRQLLGGWVHAVAPFNPVTHVMETARDLIAGTGTDYLATLGIVVGLLAAVSIFAMRGLRQAEAAG
jgi:ABC-2 type transport system permease protein